jgi:hypothetical protein
LICVIAISDVRSDRVTRDGASLTRLSLAIRTPYVPCGSIN